MSGAQISGFTGPFIWWEMQIRYSIAAFIATPRRVEFYHAWSRSMTSRRDATPDGSNVLYTWGTYDYLDGTELKMLMLSTLDGSDRDLEVKQSSATTWISVFASVYNSTLLFEPEDDPDEDEWEDGGKYSMGDIVSTGSGDTLKIWVCVRYHYAVSSHLTGDTLNSGFWVEVTNLHVREIYVVQRGRSAMFGVSDDIEPSVSAKAIDVRIRSATAEPWVTVPRIPVDVPTS